MSAVAQGISIQFNAQTDPNGFFVPVSTGITDPSNIPLTAFQIKTVPQKSLLFNVTGSIEGLNVGFGGSSNVSGSIELIKTPFPSNKRVSPGNTTTLGSEVFITQSGANITNGSGQFNFTATSSAQFNDLFFLRIVGFTNTSVRRDPTAFTASLHSFLITSEPTGSAKELVVEPYLTSPFYGTDCDVTYGNASQPVINPFLQDIDYGSGAIIPINNDAIISGSATKGTVPESFFTEKTSLNPTHKSLNTISKYNIAGSSYNTQISGGTFVVYYSNHQSTGGGTYYQTDFNVKYILTPDGEAIQITNSDESLNFLRRLFGSQVNPEGLGDNNGFGANLREVNTRAIPISGSAAGSEMKYKGPSIIFEDGAQIILRTKTFSASFPGAAKGDGGIVYPASIELTSHADLPSKARQILTENNIIPPED